MSSDNGLYILVTQGKPELPREYRVIEAQAIENIRYNADDSGFNLFELWQYFKDAKVYLNKEDAFKQATKLYEKIMMDDFCPICEYGIQFIEAYNIEFPKEIPNCCNNPKIVKDKDFNKSCQNCGAWL